MDFSASIIPDPRALWADLSSNWGLPTYLYRGEAAHNLDLSAVFRRSWLYFCPSERIAAPGTAVVGHAGDIPVVAVRGEDGTLRAFVNMCRHRGYRVAQGDKTNCARLVCGYHAWSYWTDGRLAHAPGSDDDPGFPKEELSLRPVSVSQWGPMILVNADAQAAPFLEAHPALANEAARLGMDLDPANYAFERETQHEVKSNWKVWSDNFVECYHCDNIHRGSFAAAYDSDIRTVDTRFNGTFMASRFSPKAADTRVKLRANNYRSINFFPGMLCLQQDDLMILSQMRPSGPETTEQKVHYFAQAGADPSRIADWIELWEQTFSEDGAAVAIQQEGLRTGAIERNRLMPSREEAVLFFNGLVIGAYADAQSTTT
jgi:phenylpropionate dioxygenase-like ring-hydroxylating dioxygenase large terminal subunit